MCISSVKKIKKWITEKMGKNYYGKRKKINLFLTPDIEVIVLTKGPQSVYNKLCMKIFAAAL